MKTCPKCGEAHNKSGTFCSRRCANSRVFSDAAKLKKSIATKRYLATDKATVDRHNRSKPDYTNRSAKHISNKQMRIEDPNIPFSELKPGERRARVEYEQDGRCAICGMTPLWNGKLLKFEMDHISGTRTDESRENLRLICPNCHSQTPTFKVGNNKRITSTKYSDEDLITALQKNVSGYQAIKSLGMNPHGGNYMRVRRIIKKYDLKLSYTV